MKMTDIEIESYGTSLKMCLSTRTNVLMLIGTVGVRELTEKKSDIGLTSITARVLVG